MPHATMHHGTRHHDARLSAEAPIDQHPRDGNTIGRLSEPVSNLSTPGHMMTIAVPIRHASDVSLQWDACIDS
jgi:hypothetical protein